MAEIIPFKPSSRRSADFDGFVGAQILFFTGVRYEYLADAPQKPKKSSRKSKAAPRKGRKTA